MSLYCLPMSLLQKWTRYKSCQTTNNYGCLGWHGVRRKCGFVTDRQAKVRLQAIPYLMFHLYHKKIFIEEDCCLFGLMVSQGNFPTGLYTVYRISCDGKKCHLFMCCISEGMSANQFRFFFSACAVADDNKHSIPLS